MKTQGKSSQLIAVKIGVSRQVVIPKRIHDRLGLVPGDYLQVELKGDKVIMTPQAFVAKRLAEAREDFRKGRVHGPFASGSDAVRSLQEAIKKKTA
jgi:AbrB family looped-hinge helix DNA binding protein